MPRSLPAPVVLQNRREKERRKLILEVVKTLDRKLVKHEVNKLRASAGLEAVQAYLAIKILARLISEHYDKRLVAGCYQLIDLLKLDLAEWLVNACISVVADLRFEKSQEYKNYRLATASRRNSPIKEVEKQALLQTGRLIFWRDKRRVNSRYSCDHIRALPTAYKQILKVALFNMKVHPAGATAKGLWDVTLPKGAAVTALSTPHKRYAPPFYEEVIEQCDTSKWHGTVEQRLLLFTNAEMRRTGLADRLDLSYEHCGIGFNNTHRIGVDVSSESLYFRDPNGDGIANFLTRRHRLELTYEAEAVTRCAKSVRIINLPRVNANAFDHTWEGGVLQRVYIVSDAFALGISVEHRKLQLAVQDMTPDGMAQPGSYNYPDYLDKSTKPTICIPAKQLANGTWDLMVSRAVVHEQKFQNPETSLVTANRKVININKKLATRRNKIVTLEEQLTANQASNNRLQATLLQKEITRLTEEIAGLEDDLAYWLTRQQNTPGEITAWYDQMMNDYMGA